MKLILIFAAAIVAGTSGAQAQEFTGEIGLSVGNSSFINGDDDATRLSERGYKLSGSAGVTFNDFRIFGDINSFKRDIGANNFDDYAPEGARSIGLHFGRNFGTAYAGAFIGRNQFQGSDAAVQNDYVSGKLYGIEGEYTMSNLSFFGQIGRADMVGEVDDTEFVGQFVRLGMSAVVDKMTFTVDLEQGRSANFEDLEDPGEYRAFGFAVDYQVSDRVIATVAYEGMDAIAFDEQTGADDYFSVGVRIPLGANTGKRNNLTTTYRPGLAAAWAEALD